MKNDFRKPVVLTVSLLVLFAFQTPDTQTDLFGQILDKLNTYTTVESPEKVYLHTDKDHYTQGTIIWFKTYLVHGITHEASTKSNVIYVELLNVEGNIVAQRTLYTNGTGLVAGDIELEKDIPGGNYILRAFTRYMFHGKDPVFFQKEIFIGSEEERIIGDFKNLDTIGSKKENSQIAGHTDYDQMPDIAFYPEGGHLVKGLYNTVGIKATDVQGNGMILEGKIIDGNGEVQAHFRSEDFGLGMFSFTPQADKVYYAVIDIHGKEKQYPLPEAIPRGYVLRIKNSGKHLFLEVTSNAKNDLEGTLLIGHIRGIPFFKHIGKPTEKGKYTIKLSTEALEGGVAQFTLFTATGEPVCERLTFIDSPSNEVKLLVNPDKKEYARKDKVSLDLKFEGVGENKLNGNLSMSVVKENNDLAHNAMGSDIRSWLLLDSDIGESVQDVGYFFKDGSKSRKDLLDKLMLTHGWRRFVWKELLSKEHSAPSIDTAEKGIYINGKTTTFDDHAQTRQTMVSMGIFDGGIYQDKKRTTTKGEFSFGPFAFQDSVKVILDAADPNIKNKRKAGNIAIFVDPIWPKNIPESNTIIKLKKWKPEYPNEVYRPSRELEIDAKITQLDEAVVTGKRKKTELEIVNGKINALTLHGRPDTRLFIDSLSGARAIGLLDVINTLPGVQVKGNVGFSATPSVRIRGGQNSIQLRTEPLYLLDGIAVPLEVLKEIRTIEVKFIDLLVGASASSYGIRGANGVIAVYTDRGTSYDLSLKQERSKGVTNLTVPGFYKTREFFVPKETKNEKPDRSDHQTTLHWNPNIYFENGNTRSVLFYTGDDAGRYRIKIEGITKGGKVITATSYIEVE